MRIDDYHGCFDVPLFGIQYFDETQFLYIVEILRAALALDGQVVATNEKEETRYSAACFLSLDVIVVIFDVLVQP